jgi:MFS family permease
MLGHPTRPADESARGVTAAVGNWLAFYQSELIPNNKPWQISWIAALQGAGLLFGGIFVGPLFDRGYLRSLLIAGIVITAFGFMMTSLAHKLWHLILAQGLVMGFGMSLTWTPSLSALSQWFSTMESVR